MKIIPEVKCRRCGESYPAFRSSCPNCGTRKVSQSKRAPGTTPSTVSGTAANEHSNINAKWQMIFGMILVVAVILAVVVMVSTSLDGTDKKVVQTPPPAEIVDPNAGAPVVEAPPTPTPTPPPAVEKVIIRYGETETPEFTMHIGDSIPVNAFVTPATITDKVTWSCSDEEEVYAKITVDPEDGNKCTIECLADINGGVVLYAELAGVKAECHVYLRP